MSEVKVTYETLFDVLRRERNHDEIQPLEDTFYQDVLAYMAQKKSLLSELGGTAESEKARVQFLNIKKILSELYDRREKKLVLLTLNVVRTGVQLAEKESLLAEERLLFDELVALFGRFRVDVLQSVLAQVFPFGGSTPSSPSSSSASPSAPSSSSSAPSSSSSAPSSSSSAPSSPSPSLASSADELKVRFLKAVPRFAGGGGKVFGPFSGGDEALLPEKIAAVLLKKGRVEKCA